MLTQIQLDEIKKNLEASQNPLFFFDNDVDGLCSFLILRRAIGRGRGVAIRSFPGLQESYLKKIEELNPDSVFILDKPIVDPDFLKGLYDKAIPVTWIDHHETKVDKEIIENISYFNSYPSAEPVTYLCYKAVKRKEDMFLAMIGCIGDVYKPDFAAEFAKENPDLFDNKLPIFDSLFATEIGKTAGMLNLALKDSTTNVVNMLKYFMKIKGFSDIIQENSHTKVFLARAKQLTKIHEKLVNKAECNLSEKNLLFFLYSSETSMSALVANELYFRHKDKFIVVCSKKQGNYNASIRGKTAKKVTLELIKQIEGVTGGGHEEATGIQIPDEKFDDFKVKLEELVG